VSATNICEILASQVNNLYEDVQQSSIMAMMVSLQRRLDIQSDGERERRFFSHSLQYLSTSSGRYVEIENWMVTAYEVEFGEEIGSGSL
jgi:hypothetical protein